MVVRMWYSVADPPNGSCSAIVPKISIHPRQGAAQLVQPVVGLLDAVTFTRIVNELGGNSPLPQRPVQLPRVANRGVVIVVAMDDECGRGDALQVGSG